MEVDRFLDFTSEDFTAIYLFLFLNIVLGTGQCC